MGLVGRTDMTSTHSAAGTQSSSTIARLRGSPSRHQCLAGRVPARPHQVSPDQSLLTNGRDYPVPSEPNPLVDDQRPVSISGKQGIETSRELVRTVESRDNDRDKYPAMSLGGRAGPDPPFPPEANRCIPGRLKLPSSPSCSRSLAWSEPAVGTRRNRRRCTKCDPVQRRRLTPAVILTNSVASDEGPVSSLTERLWMGFGPFPLRNRDPDWTVP